MRKGLAPLLLGVLIIAFLLFTVGLMILGGTQVVNRSTNDVIYQEPVNQMDLVYKFMKQALTFSSYQGSSEILETGGIYRNNLHSYEPDSYKIINNTPISYWYDTRKDTTENYPEENNIKNIINISTKNRMQQYLKETNDLMSRIGNWDLPVTNFNLFITDSFGSEYYYKSPEYVTYKDNNIILQDISEFKVNSKIFPLKQLTRAITGSECLISNEHKTEPKCITAKALASTNSDIAINLRDDTNSCLNSYSTSGSSTNSNCGGGYPAYPSNEQVFKDTHSVSSTQGESLIKSCIENKIDKNKIRLNRLHGPESMEWYHIINSNNADIAVYDCSTSQSNSHTCQKEKIENVDTNFKIDASDYGFRKYENGTKYSYPEWAPCDKMYDGQEKSAKEFCQYEGYDDLEEGNACHYAFTYDGDRYKAIPGEPGVKGSNTGNGAYVDKIKCKNNEKKRYDSTKSCKFSYNFNFEIIANNIDDRRTYPFYSDIDGKETSYRNMTLRFLVHMSQNKV